MLYWAWQGIGIRTGIVNTIGSVWAVNSDYTVDLLVDFYNFYHQKNAIFYQGFKTGSIKSN